MAGSGFTQLNYCFHCMCRLEPDAPVCPACGHDNSIRENNSSALPEGTILAGKYLVGRVLGQGGFGITYLGFSTALNMRVAIKEYFPTTIAMRSGNSRRAGEVTSFKDPEGFRKGREEFQAEAMTLARFNSRHIVHVRDYFMENGTGYIVMDYVEGISLTDLVKESGGSLPWDRVVELFKPLMLELNSLHEEHLIHRDIKPDNIRLTAEKDRSEHLVLLDFGSARSFVSAEITQTYTAMITPGYSPYEQYSRHSRQGPYTDIYSLCATMYALITGTVPPDSAARNIGDVVIRSFEEMGVEVPEQVSRAIMHGLSIRREDRPQSMLELYEEITGKPPVTKAQEPAPAKADIKTETKGPADNGGINKPKDLPAAPAPEKKKNSWLLPLLLAVLLAGGFFVWRNLQQSRMNTAATQTAFSLTETANALQTAAAAARTQEYAEQLTAQAQAAETSTQDALLAEQTATAWGSTVAAESGQTQTAEAAALALQTMQVETARVQGTQSAAASTAFSETRIAELHQTQTEAAVSTQLVYGEQTAAAQTATQSYEDMLSTRAVWELQTAAAQTATQSYEDLLSTRAVWEQQTAEVMEATQQAIIIAQTAMIKTQEAVNTETAGKRTQTAMEITQTEIARAAEALHATQTKMAEPTATFTPSPTSTVTMTPTAAPTLTATPSPTATEIPTNTPVPTATEAPRAALPEAGDVITFGEYEQDNDLNNGAEPIEWQVLAVEDDRALLISKYALDVKPYNETDAEVTWETSTLRNWLNRDFLFTAFSTGEQARIREEMNLNRDNERFRTFGGNATDDRIFLLSSDEAERYFSYSYGARKCSTTAYAEAKGAFISPVDGTVWWWLRTPGIAGNTAAGVDPDGAVFLNGIGVDSTTYLVRPALWLDLTETSAPAATDIPPETAATVINAEKLQAGDELTFGIYEQDNDLNNGAEPIEWLVLAVEDERALLISKYSLDARPYNETKTEVTWETCTLRNWLNGNFFNSAFSSDEKARIFTVINQNPNNPDSDADGGNPTTDQIFLLSIDEAYQYFDDDDIRKCSATAYAKANGAFVPSYWWLRSPGWENNSAASVGPNGYVFAFGDSAASTDAGIRPALWLDLSEISAAAAAGLSQETAEPVLYTEGLQAGDELTFGMYEQDNDLNNGAEPIEWLVLAVEDDRALLISKYSLDAQPYNETKTEVTWETCTLRNWLNGNFFNSAFSSDEKARIFTVINQNPKNPDSDTDGDSPTTDQIFLLSIDEAYQYFEDDDIRKCSATAYAKASGAFVPSYWWLRSPGWENNSAASVEANGNVFAFGGSVDSTDAGIRPALWLDLTVSESSVSFEIPEPTATNTVTPTETPQPTATETPVPTDTPQPTATNTPDPTLEPTEIPTEKQSSGSPYTITLLETEKTGSGDYFVNEDVMLRNSPSLQGAVVRSILKGKKVILQEETQDSWILVRSADGKEGWIPLSSITKDEKINITGSREISSADLKAGDIFLYGQYEQDNDPDNGTEPIEWQVLAVENGHALVISRYGLDTGSYNNESVFSTWENCSLRKWLNEDLLNSAFSSEDQKYVAETTLSNPDNSQYGIKGGNDTQDRIFLLSVDEANKYFADDEARKCPATAYAEAKDSMIARLASNNGTTMWWLRTPGLHDGIAARVDSTGMVNLNGCAVNESGFSFCLTTLVVRPAFWLDLSGEIEGETETVITDTPETQTPAETSDAATETTITQTPVLTETETAEPAATETPIPTAIITPVSLAAGDTLNFGSYEQDNNISNGPEAIEWVVLDTDGAGALLISKAGLEVKPYHEGSLPAGLTWESCSLRSWLNGEFFETAFSPEEQNAILSTDVSYPDKAGVADGQGTSDMVYLLGAKEAKALLSDTERIVTATDHAAAQGAAGGTWWLRSPGFNASYAIRVDGRGAISDFGMDAGDKSTLVRPVIRLDCGEDLAGIIAHAEAERAAQKAIAEQEAARQKEANRHAASIPGTILTFGSYEQDNKAANGKEPIEWIVLDSDGDKSLLLSRYGLEGKPYNYEYSVVTWEKSSLRNWLNNTFPNNAFTQSEQEAVIETLNTNPDNPDHGTDGGNDTTDKLFLLSLDELNRYLPHESDRLCAPTDYAIWQGASVDYNTEVDNRPVGMWWLRTPGNTVTCHDCEWRSSGWGCLDRQVINGLIINYQGESDVVDVSNGQGDPQVFLRCGVPNNHYAVRPAFWLDLDSDDYQIAAPYVGSPGEPVKIEKGLEAYAENSVIMDPDESSEDQVILHISGLFSFEYLEEKDYIFVIDDADRTALALTGRSDGSTTARDLIVPDGCPARSITLRAPEGKELTVNLNGKSALNSAFTMSGLNIYANGVPFTIADGLTLNGASIYGGGTAKLGNISSVPKARIVIDGGVDAVYGGGSAIDGLTAAIVGETEIIINGTVRNSVYAGGHALGGASAAVEKASVLLGETGKVGMNVVATGYASGAVPKNYTVTINGMTTINDGEGEVLICSEYGHCYNVKTYGPQYAAFRGKTNDFQIDSSSHVGTVILDIRGTVGNQVLKIATNSLVSVDQVLEQEIVFSQ